MVPPARSRPLTRSAALLALAALVSLSVAVPGGAQAQMLGGQTAAASQFIARLNEAARTLAGPRAEAEAKPCRIDRPSAAAARPLRSSVSHAPVDRGSRALGQPMDLTRLYLPPPVSS